MSLNGMDESHMSDMGATRANKFNGVPCDASQETSVRCVPLRERYYKCALNTHLDKVRDSCQFWWDDYKECIFQKKIQKKMEAVEELKEARLKEVGFKRPFWGGHTAPVFITTYTKAWEVGRPVPTEHEIGEKVDLSL